MNNSNYSIIMNCILYNNSYSYSNYLITNLLLQFNRNAPKRWHWFFFFFLKQHRYFLFQSGLSILSFVIGIISKNRHRKILLLPKAQIAKKEYPNCTWQRLDHNSYAGQHHQIVWSKISLKKTFEHTKFGPLGFWSNYSKTKSPTKLSRLEHF